MHVNRMVRKFKANNFTVRYNCRIADKALMNYARTLQDYFEAFSEQNKLVCSLLKQCICFVIINNGINELN